MKNRLKIALIAAILSVSGISMADESLTTFCEDDPTVPNYGYCTYVNPNNSSNMFCKKSETMKTCDGEG
jgi:hypothetical protein